MSELTDGDKKLISDVENIGWHIIHVMEDETGPGFSYSIGLYKTFNHPEIIVIGLSQDLSQSIINGIGEDIRNGITYSTGQYYREILENVQCLMLQVKKEHYRLHFGYANWFYRSANFPVLQCIYPTVRGIFPWEHDAPKGFTETQPILGELPFRN